MRTEKELLIVLRDHLETIKKQNEQNGLNPNFIEYGFCHEIDVLQNIGVFTDGEQVDLMNYLDSHRPKRGKHYDHSHRNCSYWWTRTLLKPRLAWLNDQIKNYHKPKTK